MEEAFWLKKWLNNEIGFHQTETNPFLKRFWNDLTAGKKGDVFVPLCGKTLDMVFIKEQGHKVYGCEISRMAVEAFYQEQRIKPSKHQELYYSEDYSIYCTDILKLDPQILKNIEFIYDRASLVALPSSMRLDYVNWLKQVGTKTKILLISFDFFNDDVGPPFSVPQKWIEQHFSDTFNIEVKAEKEITGEDVHVHQDKISKFKLTAYFLTKK